jgi:hypothetical protein
MPDANRLQHPARRSRCTGPAAATIGRWCLPVAGKHRPPTTITVAALLDPIVRRLTSGAVRTGRAEAGQGGRRHPDGHRWSLSVNASICCRARPDRSCSVVMPAVGRGQGDVVVAGHRQVRRALLAEQQRCRCTAFDGGLEVANGWMSCSGRCRWSCLRAPTATWARSRQDDSRQPAGPPALGAGGYVALATTRESNRNWLPGLTSRRRRTAVHGRRR